MSFSLTTPRLPIIDSEPASPTFDAPSRSDTLEEDSKTDYDTSQEDNEGISSSILANDPFSSESSRVLFESIDELRRCGAGQDLDLPQLIVVGKQSVGKSSLLQSLTDIPFPVGLELTTQFATRIVSRRTPPGSPDTIQASIEHGDINPFAERSDDSSSNSFNEILQTLDEKCFKELIKKATKAMGIGSPLVQKDNSYSSKVLKIELSGPKRSHFAILDLPGIFATRKGNLTTRELEGVTKMVSSYMEKPENIIICVADASVDVQNEQILELASGIDSSRKVGVFTKCDMANNAMDTVDIVNRRTKIPGEPFRWHVVQNPRKGASASSDHEEAECATFNEYPWTNIPAKQRGTAALKEHLAILLCKRIRDAFPRMQSTVTAKLQEEKLHRKSLGESRTEYSQRLAHLLTISQRYQDLAKKSLSTPDALPRADLKLRGQSKKAIKLYTEEMTSNGHYHKFLAIGRNPDAYIISGSSPHVHPLYQEIRTELRENLGEELPGVLNPFVLHPLWRTQTQKWHELTMNHLSKLITLTTNVSKLLFHQACKEVGASEQTAIALERRLDLFAKDCREEVMQKLEVLTTRNATMALQTSNPEFDDKVRKARKLRFSQAIERYINKHLHFAISNDIYSSATAHSEDTPKPGGLFGAPAAPAPATAHGENAPKPSGLFGAPVAPVPKASSAFGAGGSKGLFGSSLFPATTGIFSNPSAVIYKSSADDLFNELHPNGSRSQNVEDEIHDLLQAYYEITLQNFIYDVTHNIDEPFLVNTKGPLLGLNAKYIMGLSVGEVAELAADEEVDVVARRESELRIGRLEEAVRIAEGALKRTKELGI